MSVFEQAGHTMLLAAEGQRLLANALVTGLKRWVASFKTWLSDMPTTLPPTECFRR